MSNPSPKENQSDNYPIQVHTNSNPEVKKLERQRLVHQIMCNMYRQGKVVPDEVRVIEELEKHGFYLDITTLRDDLYEINKTNTFVLDLARRNYNSEIEAMFGNLHGIIRECDKTIAKKWTRNSLHITEENNTITKKEKIITDELAGPKIQANKVKLDAIKVLNDIYQGGIVDVSLALFIKQVHKMRLELEDLKQQNEALQTANAELGKKENSTSLSDNTK